MPRVRRLTLRVVADLLFSTDLTTEAVAVIDRAVEEIHAWAESDPANEDLANEPESFRSAIADLHALIDSVIADPRLGRPRRRHDRRAGGRVHRARPAAGHRRTCATRRSR